MTTLDATNDGPYNAYRRRYQEFTAAVQASRIISLVAHEALKDFPKSLPTDARKRVNDFMLNVAKALGEAKAGTPIKRPNSRIVRIIAPDQLAISTFQLSVSHFLSREGAAPFSDLDFPYRLRAQEAVQDRWSPDLACAVLRPAGDLSRPRHRGSLRRSAMRHKKVIIFAGVVAALLLAGCGSPPQRVLSQKPPSYAALPNGHDPLHPDQLSPLYAAMAGETNVIRQIERKRGHALNVLSLSGGGQNGAFGAGLLIGWRESGQRPEFDIVGGVSTGALLATHALLGTPADDAQLEEMYTQITKKNVHKERWILSLAFGADSLSDTAPLRELIAKHITAETLKRVAAAHNDNRLLVVGTTNIDYGQTWVWNMSLIAKDGNLALYREVLLASASFPIVFPPVEIDGHLFVDGAARSNVVIAGMGGTERPGPPLYGPGNVYLVDNGRLHSPPEALRRALGDVAATTISVMMDQSMLTAMTRSYVGAKFLGYNFKMVAIPDNVNIGKDPLAFDPKQMRAAFDAGRALAKRPDHWVTVPPDLGDIPSWALEQIK